MVEPIEKQDAIPKGAQERLQALKDSLKTKASTGSTVAAFTLERLNAAKESRDQLNLQLRGIRNLPEFGTLDGNVQKQLHELQDEVEQASEKIYRVGTESIGTAATVTGNVIGEGTKMGVDAFNKGSSFTKLGIIGGTMLVGSQVIGWIRSWFGEKGKQAGDTIKGWGRTIGRWTLAAAAALGIGSFFGYNVKKDDAQSYPEKEKEPTAKKAA